MSGAHLLSVADLRVSYDGIPALRGISFDVPDGEIVTLIGANGAGKSTTLRALSGIVPFEGSVTFAGAELRGLTPRGIVARGLVHGHHHPRFDVDEACLAIGAEVLLRTTRKVLGATP